MTGFITTAFSDMTIALLTILWFAVLFWCIQELTKIKLVDVPPFLTAAVIFLLWVLSALGMGLQMVFK